MEPTLTLQVWICVGCSLITRPPMRIRYCSLLATIILTGCASQPVILDRSEYWPFEKLRLKSDAVGVFTAYGYRAPRPTRAIVIVQSPPCTTTTSDSADPLLSTAGILWDELKEDSVLLQLERPGLSTTQVVPRADCQPAPADNKSPKLWSRAVREALAAYAGPLKLPTVYIGIGRGAVPAVELAATDPNTASLLIVNGIGLYPGFEAMLTELRGAAGRAAQDLLQGTPAITPTIPAASSTATNRQREQEISLFAIRPKAPILLVQSTANRDSQLASAALLLVQRAAAGRSASVIVAEGLGPDFGLDSGRTTCFENMMGLIAQYARALGEPVAPPLRRVYCSSPAQEPPQRDRTEPMRLPLEAASESNDER